MVAAGLISARAADSPPAGLTLSLNQARQLALERNDDFRVAQFQVTAAVALLRAAREYPNPTLSLSTAQVPTDGSKAATTLGNGLLDRSYDSIVALSQLLPIAKRGVQQDAAGAAVRVAQSQREDAQRLLLQSVTQAYIGAVSAREQAEVLERSAAALRREATIAQHRLEAGDLSESDEAQIEIAADQDELAAETQRTVARTAVIALETLLGEPSPDGSTALSDRLSALVPTDPAFADLPPGHRPDVAAAEAAVAQAEAAATLQRRQRIPDVTVTVQYEREPPDQTNTGGIGLSLPLPVWNRNTGNWEAAKAARSQAEAQLDKVRIQAAADAAQARFAYREAAQRMQRYLAAVVPKSARATRSVAYAYEKGGTSLVNLLEAERNDNSVGLAAVQAQADTAVAASGLLTALGRLEPATAGPPLSP
jgi:cobalt-zinc-cadmium efflux system outer membrane protein